MGHQLFAQISFTEKPEDMQVVPRDLSTNVGAVRLVGTADASGQLRVVVHRNEQSTAWKDRSWNVSGNFSKRIDIPAERINYDFTIYFDGDVVATANDVVAGDVIVAHGQSNATAVMRDGLSANSHQDPFVRAFGVQFAWEGPWLQAEGDKNSVIAENLGSVGQWALRLAKRLSDEEGIPIAILNGSRTAKAIQFFLRKESDPEDTDTNYGRLLTRTRNAGVDNHIRAFVWYQGTSDVIEGNTVETYANRFDDLYNDWMEDYPGLEVIYMMQNRRCKEYVALELQEWQRQRDGDPTYPLLQVVSTNGLAKYEDNCHYSRQGHYDLADRLFPLMQRDLYDRDVSGDIESPDVDKAAFADPDILQVLLAPDQTINVDPQANSLFTLHGSDATVTSATLSTEPVSGLPCVELTLDGDASGTTHVSYTGYQEVGIGPEVKNATGIGLLAFHEVPVLPSILPIEITSFTGTSEGRRVTLFWETDANESGDFEVQHERDDVWSVAGYVEASPKPDAYRFELEVLTAGIHRFRLRVVEADGDVSFSDVVEIFVHPDLDFSIESVYPNPVDRSAKAVIFSKNGGHLRLTLNDLLGRQIALLHDAEIRRNERREFDLDTRRLPSGVYVLTGELGGVRRVRQMSVAR